jgi:hypothetical protein
LVELGLKHEYTLNKLEKFKKVNDKLRGWRVEMSSYIKVLLKNQHTEDDETDKELNSIIQNKCHDQMRQLLDKTEIEEKKEKEIKKVQQ